MIPTRDEINVYDSLDERVAVEHFLGKDLIDAEQLFQAQEGYTEDMMHMGPVAFRYYVRAAINCLRNAPTIENWSLASGLLGAFELRLEFEEDVVAPIADELASICEFILEHYDQFDRLPKDPDEITILRNCMREQFDKLKDVLGTEYPENLDYWLDLRPRLRKVRDEFLRLSWPK